MKYHSKTPEEWEKYDKEKEKKDIIKKMHKKRRRTNNLIIIMISSFAIVIIMLSKYYFPRYKFSEFLLVNGISFSLMSNSEYTYPDNLDINVNMYNTKNKVESIKIDSFKFNMYKITDNSSKTFYTFEYPEIINYDLIPLENKKIFDLKNINPMSKIPNGKYIIETNFNYNGKKIKLKKEINYIHTIKYNIYLNKDFYLDNEYPKLYIEVKNYSENTKNINVMGKIEIYTQKRKLVKEIKVNLGYATLKSLEKEIYEVNIPPLKKGNYELYFVSESLNQAVYILLPISNIIEKKLSKVTLSIDTYLFYPINELFRGVFYINNNDFKKERYIQIEGYYIRLLNMENNTIIFNYENNDKRRIFINAGGKKLIHIISDEPPIQLSIPGNYQLIFGVKSNENTIERKMDLYVGISQ
ncbi:hypothetical protein JCM30566_13010 [Marinitoga arctica]